MGLYVQGRFLAAEARQGRDGYSVSVNCGMDTYRISVPDVPREMTFGAACMLRVRPNVYNGKLYFAGEFVGKED